jgi:hypothetical protein
MAMAMAQGESGPLAPVPSPPAPGITDPVLIMDPPSDAAVAVSHFDSNEATSTFEISDANSGGNATVLDWLDKSQTGYDSGFVIASRESQDLAVGDYPFVLRMNGWGQLREVMFNSGGVNPDQNQFQLVRGRLIFSGSAFIPDFRYLVQLDGRSSSGDTVRLLDYFLNYDVGHDRWGCQPGTIEFVTGKYKMPFQLARSLSGREFEFCDRSMASAFFDVNRSLAWGLRGKTARGRVPIDWEAAIFNGFVTGGAETGSSGSLDNNFAFSARLFCFPTGDWGSGSLADFDWHDSPATRVGAGIATTSVNRIGSNEFTSSRVVDSGLQLSTLLPQSVTQYDVSLYSLDASLKYRGWSSTIEYYFRTIDGFEGGAVSDLYDHGFWFQVGKFVVPDRLQLLARWSRIVGDSGTLGVVDQSSDEVAGGLAWYIRGQHAKFTVDATYLNGASVSSSALAIAPGDIGWLYRTQIQFSF